MFRVFQAVRRASVVRRARAANVRFFLATLHDVLRRRFTAFCSCARPTRLARDAKKTPPKTRSASGWDALLPSLDTHWVEVFERLPGSGRRAAGARARATRRPLRNHAARASPSSAAPTAPPTLADPVYDPGPRCTLAASASPRRARGPFDPLATPGDISVDARIGLTRAVGVRRAPTRPSSRQTLDSGRRRAAARRTRGRGRRRDRADERESDTSAATREKPPCPGPRRDASEHSVTVDERSCASARPTPVPVEKFGIARDSARARRPPPPPTRSRTRRVDRARPRWCAPRSRRTLPSGPRGGSTGGHDRHARVSGAFGVFGGARVRPENTERPTTQTASAGVDRTSDRPELPHAGNSTFTSRVERRREPRKLPTTPLSRPSARRRERENLR